MKRVLLGAIASIALVSPVLAKEEFQFYSPEMATALGANPKQNTWIVETPAVRMAFVDHNHSGSVETHDRGVDHITVLAGAGSVIVGGTVTGNKLIAPGEWHGTSSTGGKTYELKPGSILIIPPGVPHQFVIPSGGHLAFTLIKNMTE